jgi:hypothetical protein
MVKPGNFALIEEIKNGKSIPLGVVDSVTTARRTAINLAYTAINPYFDNIEFMVTRFTNGKPSYQWHLGFAKHVGLWSWTKTYKRLWDATYSFRQFKQATKR